MSWHKLLQPYQGCRYERAKQLGVPAFERVLSILQCECALCRKSIDVPAKGVQDAKVSERRELRRMR